MKTPFSLSFPPYTIEKDIQRSALPVFAKYAVPFTDTRLYQKKEFFIIRQFYKNFITYLELYQGHMNEQVPISLVSQEPGIFFIYLLEGVLMMNVQSTGEKVILSYAGHCHAHGIAAGEYQILLQPGNYSVFYFLLRNEWFEQTMSKTTIYANIRQWLHSDRSGNFGLPEVAIDSNASNLIRKLQYLATEPELKLNTELLNILEKLISSYDQQLNSASKRPATPQALAAAMYMHIQEAVISGRQINLSQLAVQLFTTPKTLSRAFKLTFKTCPQQYILQRRMGKAHELIVNTGHTLPEISAMLGYSIYSSFCRRFSAHFGFPPDQLRARRATDL